MPSHKGAAVMAEEGNRRRQYIINQGFQYKLIFSFVTVVALTIAVSHALAMAAAKWFGTGQAAQQLSQIKGSLQQPLSWDILWVSALASGVLGIVLALLFGRHYSNRIAGPLYNLKRVMSKVGSGDLTTEMHIRCRDEFHDVETAFNQMVAGLNHNFDLVQKAVQDLPEPHRARLQRKITEVFSAPAASPPYQA
jgi:methyl-accepting chemotaxis protein